MMGWRKFIFWLDGGKNSTVVATATATEIDHRIESADEFSAGEWRAEITVRDRLRDRAETSSLILQAAYHSVDCCWVTGRDI